MRKARPQPSGIGEKPRTTPRDQPKAAPISRDDLWICLCLFVATFLVYVQVRQFDFVNFDDPEIFSNSHVLPGITLDGIKWALTSGDNVSWVPLTRLSHLVAYEFFGRQSGLHHLTNVLFHALAALLLFAFLNRATRRPLVQRLRRVPVRAAPAACRIRRVGHRKKRRSQRVLRVPGALGLCALHRVAGVAPVSAGACVLRPQRAEQAHDSHAAAGALAAGRMAAAEAAAPSFGRLRPQAAHRPHFVAASASRESSLPRDRGRRRPGHIPCTKQPRRCQSLQPIFPWTARRQRHRLLYRLHRENVLAHQARCVLSVSGGCTHLGSGGGRPGNSSHLHSGIALVSSFPLPRRRMAVVSRDPGAGDRAGASRRDGAGLCGPVHVHPHDRPVHHAGLGRGGCPAPVAARQTGVDRADHRGRAYYWPL